MQMKKRRRDKFTSNMQFPSPLSSLDRGEEADAAHYANIGVEKVVREDTLLEAAELQQPPEDGSTNRRTISSGTRLPSMRRQTLVVGETTCLRSEEARHSLLSVASASSARRRTITREPKLRIAPLRQ